MNDQRNAEDWWVNVDVNSEEGRRKDSNCKQDREVNLEGDSESECEVYNMHKESSSLFTDLSQTVLAS